MELYNLLLVVKQNKFSQSTHRAWHVTPYKTIATIFDEGFSAGSISRIDLDIKISAPFPRSVNPRRMLIQLVENVRTTRNLYHAGATESTVIELEKSIDWKRIKGVLFTSTFAFAPETATVAFARYTIRKSSGKAPFPSSRFAPLGASNEHMSFR